MRRKTHEQFMREMRKGHPNIQVLGEYINNRTKIKLKCGVCDHEFDAVPASLYMGHGCPKCAGVCKKTHEKYVHEMQVMHPTIEVLGEYLHNKLKVKLRCLVCGEEWKSTPNASLRGNGCPHCSGLTRKTQEQFVNEMKRKHPNIEVLGIYVNNRTKVLCKCLDCGEEFLGIPHAMLDSWRGCPRCAISVGEKSIRSWLKQNNIVYIPEYTFDDCRDQRVLPFDFYLPDHNTIIEYDGQQHFERNDYWGGEAALKIVQYHDKIKNEYCMANNIALIRIPYWDFKNISNILTRELAI